MLGSVSGVLRSINFALPWAPFVRNERHTRWSGRRGWQQADVPTEWVQIIRGPRPKAEKWSSASAKAQVTPNQGGWRWRRGAQSAGRSSPFEPRRGISWPVSPLLASFSSPGQVFPLSANFSSLGQFALSRPVFPRRLEAALGVFAECDSAETRTLRDSLQHARRSAQEQPFTAQIKDTEDFIARSMKRIKEEQLLESATRLARLRQMVSSVPPPTELDAQVAELKAKLAVAEAERDARAKEGPGRTRRSFNGRQWCRHSHAGSRPEAGTSWGSSFHIATRGTPEGFARGCCFRQTHRSRESLRVHDQSSPGMAADDTRAIPFRAKRGCQHGEVTHSIHCSGRWGLRWIRVGEVSNPCSTASVR